MKGNRTPWEAYGHTDPEKYAKILQRVEAFKNKEKLRRFEMKSPDEWRDFVNRQLNDTRYFSTLACDYLRLLYNGQPGIPTDMQGKTRVQVSRGQLTHFMRTAWGLKKDREDHRHHAEDATLTALVSPGFLKTMTDAAKRAESAKLKGIRVKGRLFGKLPEPWSGFKEQLRTHLMSAIVSHLIPRKTNGALHEETFYGRKTIQGQTTATIRKELRQGLTAPEIDRIVDPAVRSAIESHIRNGGKVDSLDSPPLLILAENKTIPIRRVLLMDRNTTHPIGTGEKTRYVKLGDNHHMEIYEAIDKRSRNNLKSAILTLYDVRQRKQRQQPVHAKNLIPGAKYLFSLMKGDILHVEQYEEGWQLCQVRQVCSDNRIRCIPIHFAGQVRGSERSIAISKFPQLGVRKVALTPLGEIRPFHE